MPYWQLYEKLRDQEPPQYDYDRTGRLHRRETPESNYVKYNDYMMKISSEMDRLSRGYNRIERTEDFYSWAVSQR